MTLPLLSLSIVSHGHGRMISALLEDLANTSWNSGHSFEVIITLNIPEDETWLEQNFGFPLTVLRNQTPKGFGYNHNVAFSVSRGTNFAVLNPDIRLGSFQIAPLLLALANPEIGVVAPLILGPDDSYQDSARHFPTLRRLLKRKLLRQRQLDYAISNGTQQVEWLAGMFLLFRATVYKDICGFDQRYFMYMEDVEICRFLQRRGLKVLWVPSVSVVHDAARASQYNFSHLRWHIASIVRYLFIKGR